MKTKSAIVQRLHNLRLRYAKQHVKASQAREHKNCSFNHQHTPLSKLDYNLVETEYERAPRKNVSLVVIQDQAPIRLCMYGASNPSDWGGTICDDDNVAISCPYFKPLTSAQQAREQFMELLRDDEYVLDNFQDLATLQWVLGERIHQKNLGILARISLWFATFRARPNPVPKQLSAAPDIPNDLWDSK